MKFNTTSFQSQLFDINDYVITISTNGHSEKIHLPPAKYNGVMEYPYMLQRQFIVGNKISQYLDIPFTWPDITQFSDLSQNTYGEAIPNEGTIKYSHKIKDSYWLQTIVPGHEIAHLQPRGLDKILQMYSVYVVFDGQRFYSIPVPIGRMLVEGGTEVLLEKVHEPRGGYESWYQLTSKIDQSFPVKSLFYTIQNYGSTGVWQRLHSGPMELIDSYVLDSLKESGLKEPIIVGRADF